MKKVIRITENDLTRIVKRVLNENVIDYPFPNRKTISIINNEGKNVDVDCELAQTPEEKKQGLLYRDRDFIYQVSRRETNGWSEINLCR